GADGGARPNKPTFVFPVCLRGSGRRRALTLRRTRTDTYSNRYKGDPSNEEACDDRGPRHRRTRTARPGEAAASDASRAPQLVRRTQGGLPGRRHGREPEPYADP